MCHVARGRAIWWRPWNPSYTDIANVVFLIFLWTWATLEQKGVDRCKGEAKSVVLQLSLECHPERLPSKYLFLAHLRWTMGVFGVRWTMGVFGVSGQGT